MMHQLYYDMIIEDYNAKGGLYVPEYGKRLNITLKSYDDESNEMKCLTLIEKLITEDNVDLMFAPWSTEFNVAAFQLFEQYKMPAVALTVGSDHAAQDMKDGEVTYSFVTLGQPYEDAKECTDLFTYINSNLATDTTRISKIGILYRSDLHGTEHSKALGDAFTTAGFTVTKIAYDPAIADFTPLIQQLQSADVDVAMVCGYAEAFLFVIQCKALDYNPKMIFHGPVLETPLMMYAVFQFTPGDIAGLAYYNGFPSTNYTSPTMAAWAQAHRVRTGFYPFPAAGPAFYTGVECLFKAVELVGLDHTKIRDALRTTTWNDTLMGTARLRIGQSIEVQGTGTLTQWTGKEMMDVIWPRTATKTNIIYPKLPWSWATVPDVNRDGKVNMVDIGTAANSFGAMQYVSPKWRMEADVVKDGKIDMKDIGTTAKNFGKQVDWSELD